MDDAINNLAYNNIKHVKRGELQANGTSPTVGVSYGMLWLDVEGTQYWSGNAQSNIDFLQGMVDQGNRRGVTMGKTSIHFKMMSLFNSLI